MRTQTVLILHNQEIGWAAVRTVLQERCDVQIVGDETSHDTALRLATARQINLVLASDLVGRASSQVTLAAIRAVCPDARIALFVRKASLAAMASTGQFELAACCGWDEQQLAEAIAAVLDATTLAA